MQSDFVVFFFWVKYNNSKMLAEKIIRTEKKERNPRNEMP